MQNLWRIHQSLDVDLASVQAVLRNLRQMEAASGISGKWRLACLNLSRTQIDIMIAQSCQAEQTVHDTYHILHSHHAKYFPISQRHNQYYESPILKGMVPVSPTGTNGSLDKMDVMCRTYSTCLLLLHS